MIAPCIGPHIRSHAIGGPACRIALAHAGHHAGDADPFQHRLRRLIGRERLPVGRFDRG